MSHKSKSSTGSWSDFHEDQDDSRSGFEKRTTRKKKSKLGASFLCENWSTTSQLGPNQNSEFQRKSNDNSSDSGCKQPWTKGKPRAIAALWPSGIDNGNNETDESEEIDRNENTKREFKGRTKKEESEHKVQTPPSDYSGELGFVTEQLQIIQETQDMILSDLRSNIESLQTENLCLQHSNSKLRIQIDHLNDLVYQLSKELNLTRDFVNARKDHLENNLPTALRESLTSIISSRSPESPSPKSRPKARAKSAGSSKGSNKNNADTDTESTKLSSKKSKHKGKEKSSKEDKPPKTRRGFFSSFFRPRVFNSAANSE